MQTEKGIVHIKDLTVGYTNSKIVLEKVSFSLPPHKIIGIIGPNGAGKSTLLKAAMGLIPHQKGVVKLFGEPIDKVRKRISYVPQKESVDWDFPASVFDIALLGRYNRLGFFERPNKRDKAITMQCLEKLGMAHLAKRQIGGLSGGQQQRVFLARALAQDAELYFLDEPFTGIDVTTEKIVITLLKNMVTAGKTIVVVHHNLGSVYRLAKGEKLNDILSAVKGVSEGVQTVQTIHQLMQSYGGKAPITAVTYRILFEELPLKQGFDYLMRYAGRSTKN